MRVRRAWLVIGAAFSLAAIAAEEPFTDVPTQTFEEPSPVFENAFSYSLAANGGDILIGSVGDFENTPGTVYLFDVQTGDHLRTFPNQSPFVDNFFGSALAIAGDYVFIAASEDDTFGSRAGAVYQMRRDDGQLEFTYNSPTPTDGGHFGAALAIQGTLLIVGENGADPDGVTGAGAVHVFDFMAGSFERSLTKPAAIGGELLGDALAVVGDYIAAGAQRDAEVADQAGAVHVFDAASGAYRGTIRKSVETTNEFDRFGSSLAALAATLIVGSPLDLDESPPEARPGAAFLFDADPDGPGFGDLLATFHNPTPAYLDRFGFSVAAVGENVLVGAFGDDTGATNAGAVYVFDTAGILLQEIRKDTPAADDWFGWSLASAGGSALVGSQLDDTPGPVDAGAAYLFGNTPTGTGVESGTTSSDGSSIVLTFDEITSSGVTTATQVECPAEPPLSLFELCDPPTCHDIETTATFVPTAEGGIRVCIDYGGSGCPLSGSEEANIRLRHDEDGEGTLDDITDDGYPDTTNDVICGTTTHLSLFELALAVVPQHSCVGFAPPLHRRVPTIRPGRVLPLRAKLLDDGGGYVTDEDLSAAPRVRVSYRVDEGEFVDVTDDVLSAGVGVDGNAFVYVGCGRWRFNLKTTKFTDPGLYVVEMSSGDEGAYLVDPTCTARFRVRPRSDHWPADSRDRHPRP